MSASRGSTSGIRRGLPRLGFLATYRRRTAPALAVLAGTADAMPTVLDLPQLARLLYLSAGGGGTKERPYATLLFRAAGSTGGRFPSRFTSRFPTASTYPQASTVTTHSTTRWRGSGRRRAVRHLPSSSRAFHGVPAGATESVGSGTSIGTRARCSRNCWRSPTPRAHRAPLTRFPDAIVAALVGADGVHEWPVAVVALSDGAPALESSGEAAMGEVDESPIEFPLVT